MKFKQAVPIAIVGAGVALVGSACASDTWSDWHYTPASGTVVEKEHEEAERYQDCQTDRVYNSATGKYENKRNCHWVYEDECYEIDFETPEGEVLEECTTKELYEALKVGDVYIEEMPELATHTPWLTPSSSAPESS